MILNLLREAVVLPVLNTDIIAVKMVILMQLFVPEVMNRVRELLQMDLFVPLKVRMLAPAHFLLEVSVLEMVVIPAMELPLKKVANVSRMLMELAALLMGMLRTMEDVVKVPGAQIQRRSANKSKPRSCERGFFRSYIHSYRQNWPFW